MVETQVITQINSNIVAIQYDIEAVPLQNTKKHNMIQQKEQIYVLDNEAILHCFSIEDDMCSVTTNDFTGHNLNKIIEDDWNRCHLSSKAVIDKQNIYTPMSNSNKSDNENTIFKWGKKVKEGRKIPYTIEQLSKTSKILAIGSEEVDLSK